jgi:calcineurin-like phosphoesterase
VPTTRLARPSHQWPIAIFSLVASAWMSMIDACASPPSGCAFSAASTAENGSSKGRFMKTWPSACTTSEKMAMGHWCDGRASLVVGTHTHVPTADAQLLPGGTAYQTDAGMCGDYNSVIGMDKAEPLRRFITGMARDRFEPAAGEATLSGVYAETDDRTGLATRVRMIRLGGRLEAALP